MAKRAAATKKTTARAQQVAAKDDLVRRLARQGNLDRRTAEDLKETFRSFVGEARGLVGE